MALFPSAKSRKPTELEIDLGYLEYGGRTLERNDKSDLPPSPVAGFVGRDDSILEIDRSFDSQNVVLLHSYSGSGKTALAVEFAHWYTLTGGADSRAIFTSFEHYIPLARVLDCVGNQFKSYLLDRGINWLAKDRDEKWRICIALMKEIRIIWIWDNVEAIARVPIEAETTWDAEEQQELRDFLRECQGTKSCVLLTSRHEERNWLGALPVRVCVPPMRLIESFQMARSLAANANSLAPIDAWKPILEFSAGNPLTVGILVSHALRERIERSHEARALVRLVGEGRRAVEGEHSESLLGPLEAALGYGLDVCFEENERRRLALLHMFRGTVEHNVLRTMGNPEASWCLPDLRRIQHEECIELLDRAVEAGLLSFLARGTYQIHPALPGTLREFFDRYHRKSKNFAKRAYAEATATVAQTYSERYIAGQRQWFVALQQQEDNLIRSVELAIARGWPEPLARALASLSTLYSHAGRIDELDRMFERAASVVDLTKDPPPESEHVWLMVLQYRARTIAGDANRWPEAHQLQQTGVDWIRRRLGQSQEGRGDRGFRIVLTRNLAQALITLGTVQVRGGQKEAVSSLEEAHSIALRIRDLALAANSSLALANAYCELPFAGDLEVAITWLTRGLDYYRQIDDSHGMARCLSSLGRASLSKFVAAHSAGDRSEGVYSLLDHGVERCLEALEYFPSHAVADLAVAHKDLGALYAQRGDVDQSLVHCQQAIGYYQILDDIFGVGTNQFNISIAMIQAGRTADALEYANAACDSFRKVGLSAVQAIVDASMLVQRLELELS